MTVHLTRTVGGDTRISFGVPLASGVVDDVSKVRVRVAGVAVDADVTELLPERDAEGNRVGSRAILVQLDSAIMATDELDVDVLWSGSGAAPGSDRTEYEDVGLSADVDEVVTVTERTIEEVDGQATLIETSTEERTVLTALEPRVLATWPDGYLASTGFLGEQVTADDAAASGRAGLSFFSTALSNFTGADMYQMDYGVHPDAVVDPATDYEGWLYDRCATYLIAYTHSGETAHLQQAHRACDWYGGMIELTGDNRGIFLGKPEADIKYSHNRGLYYYYMLTGNEGALEAGQAIAELWEAEPDFVAPYRAGHLRSESGLWTERLLGTSLEGMIYGYLLTGDTIYVDAFEEMLDTATSHITGDADALAVVNPYNTFPPQDCFIHSAAQHGEGTADEPWCSGWMSELTIDPLLRWQELTEDDRVDEIFVRLTRFLRDTGSMYFRGNPLADSYLEPSICFDATDTENPRVAMPAYGSGIDADGDRQTWQEYEDPEHCADTTALTAAGLRALMRQGGFDANPVGPFASEGESFLALHHDMAFCASYAFDEGYRPNRDPATWDASELAAGLADPQAFLVEQHIGWPVYRLSAQRELSWWFNSSLTQFQILADAGIDVSALEPGQVEPCE